MNRRLLIIVAVLLAFASVHAAPNPTDELNYLGSYSNMRFTEEHQYGSEVELWATGNIVVGLFFWSQGLMGDTPTGTIENVVYDPQTGKLSFTSKLTTGSHYCKVHHDVPSQDLFKFKGTLKQDALSGELSHLQALDKDAVMSNEQVILKRVGGNQAPEYQRTTFAEFQKRAKTILEFRGPKW